MRRNETGVIMKKIAFYDVKPYDRVWFDRLNNGRYELEYFESKLNAKTAALSRGCQGVIAFVNDDINADCVRELVNAGVQVLAMRSAGYSNVDLKEAYDRRLTVVRVPAYSPYAVAEFTMGLLLNLNRKIHKAYIRTKDFNFSLNGLTGFDLHGKTVGVIGGGKIGRAFMEICKGFGMQVLAYDPFPGEVEGVRFVPLEELYRNSDVISLHCPLTESTFHLLNQAAFSAMKQGVLILNTSRGALIDSAALLEALNSRKVGGAALDVYEEEADLFFEDRADTLIRDDLLALLLTRPNVILTSHQAFLTEEALRNIADTTLNNLDEYFSGGPLTHEVCYRCKGTEGSPDCRKTRKERCFPPRKES